MVLLLGVCAWAIGWFFEFGRNTPSFSSDNQEVAKLREEIEILKLEQIKSKEAPPSSLIVAERATQERLLERVKILEAENQVLFEDLNFYQKLIPSKPKDNLSVRGLEVQRKSPQLVEWEFLLIQTRKDASALALRVEPVVMGTLNGQAWTSPPQNPPMSYTVQQSSRLAGTLTVPDALVLKSVTVKVYDGKTLRSSQTIENL